AQTPTARNPVNEVQTKPNQTQPNPTARVLPGDPPLTAGLHGPGKGPGTGLQTPGGDATASKLSAPLLGRTAQRSRPGLQAGSRAGPSATHRFEPRSRGFSVLGFSRMAPAPAARNPVTVVPHARAPGDPPSTAGLHGGGKGPGTGLQTPGG